MLGASKTIGALHVLSICVKLASQTLKHVRGRFYGWTILELVENRLIFAITRFFVFAGSGFVVGRLWASEALHVLVLCLKCAYGTLGSVTSASERDFSLTPDTLEPNVGKILLQET